MRTTNETCEESNYSSFIKDTYQKNSLGYFPLLKFKENLYNTCQSKFSEYANSKKGELKLIINNKINQQISINDYIHNSSNEIGTNKLTPIPSINKRKIKNEGEKKELKNFQRNVVLMRRLEYTNKMKEKTMKKKYKNKYNQIIFLQKMIRGYLVRKVISQVNIINDTLTNFIFLISFCIKKKFFFFFKKNILKGRVGRVNEEGQFGNKGKQESDKSEKLNHNSNTNNENTNRNEFFINIENEYKPNNKEKLLEEEKNNELLMINKEKLNIIDDNNNINNSINSKGELNVEEKSNYKNNDNNINNKSEKNLNNNEIKQNKTNPDNINNNEKNISKEKDKRSLAKLTDQLNEIKKENNGSNTLNNQILKISKYNSPNNIDSIIDNDDYVDFSGKCSLKKNIKIINNKNNINDKNINYNANKNAINYTLSEISTNNLRKTKTETIQRQFRKYLYKKGYYGNFDKRKIAIIYLLKNMILYNIKLYLFNILKLIYKDIKDISITQDDNYINISSERIENIKQTYNFAISNINFN